MAPLNGRPPNRREKPSSATSVIDIGSNPRTIGYPGKLVKEKEKIAGQTTLKIGNLQVNSYDNGLLRVPAEEREEPQVRNSIESRLSAVIRIKTRKGSIAVLGGQMGPGTNN